MELFGNPVLYVRPSCSRNAVALGWNLDSSRGPSKIVRWRSYAKPLETLGNFDLKMQENHRKTDFDFKKCWMFFGGIGFVRIFWHFGSHGQPGCITWIGTAPKAASRLLVGSGALFKGSPSFFRHVMPHNTKKCIKMLFTKPNKKTRKWLNLLFAGGLLHVFASNIFFGFDPSCDGFLTKTGVGLRSQGLPKCVGESLTVLTKTVLPWKHFRISTWKT